MKRMGVLRSKEKKELIWKIKYRKNAENAEKMRVPVGRKMSLKRTRTIPSQNLQA